MIDKGEWNWTDGGQVLLGGGLMIPGLNGAIVLSGEQFYLDGAL